MKQVEIDDEVFAYLQGKAVPYVETPNLTLRRLFRLDGSVKEPSPQEIQIQTSSQKKQRKADLHLLVEAGLLQAGQTLFLYNYQGKKLEGYEATVSGKYLLNTDGKTYSMSHLAKKFLKQKGFRSDSVRGPAHWFNADGISIKQLWEQYLNKYNVN